ncbi:aminotransferase class IV [Lacihabitans sp. CS3-21]|uniref:aminotransferase class IV n=1 Tax=Lacihabitans sp. CS3-21 TaxID=2487332 RepID=UPI0020CC122C|nr:aminotransferase class IV [Lacihabitans sp. CS3-21]MCP9747789.1 chorismate-binding protein [Lacihabitans sp. CS3-21]
MYQFFESIKLQDGKMHLLDLHSERLNRTRNAFFENIKDIDLEKELMIPCEKKNGLYKVKVVYAKYLESVTIDSYTIKDHHKIKLLEKPNIKYDFKFLDRKILDEDFNQNADFDDVIFLKNGILTDATYSNLVFFDGNTWFTPENYLLNGIRRKALLDSGIITEKKILKDDIQCFQKIAFINAMRDFEKMYTFVHKDDFLLLNPSS